MNANPAIDNLVTELSPELAGVIGQPPSMDEGAPPPKVPGYTAPERDSAKKTATEAVRDGQSRTLMRKFGAIAAAIGNPDRVRVWKRQPNGVLGFVEEYRWRDIQHTGDLEVFLSQYVKPMPPPAGGPGEYPIRIIDVTGKEYDAGSIHLIGAPPSAAQPQSDLASVVRELKDVLRPMPTPDPLEAMERAQAFAERLKGKSNDPFAMMMMMRAMEPPKDDSRILSALEKIVTRIEKLESNAGAPLPMLPMAPPAPSMSPLEIVTAVTTALKTVVDVTRAPPAPAIDPFAMAKMLADASKEGAAAAEKHNDRLISMLENRDRREQPVASLTDEMEKMKTLHEFVKSFSPPQQPQGNSGTNFWDAMLAFANNEKFAGNIGEAIRERAKQQPGQATITTNRPVPPKQIPQQAQPHPQPQQPRPQTAPPPFVPNGQPAPVQTTPSPVQPEVVPAAEAAQPSPAQPEPPRIFVPDSFKPFCERLDAAAITPVDGKIDDGTIATRTIEGLMELFKLAQWRPSVEALLDSIDQDQKEKALTILGNTLSLLARNGWLQRDSAIHSLRVLRDQWDLVRGGVQQLLKTAPIFASPPPAIAPPADPETPASPSSPAALPDEVMHEVANDEQEEQPPPG